VKATRIALCVLLLGLCPAPAAAGTIWNVVIKNKGHEPIVVRQTQSKCWLPGSFEKPLTIRPGESQELFSEMDDLKACNTSVNKEWFQELEVKSSSKTRQLVFSFNKKRFNAKGDWFGLKCDAPSACCSTCRISYEFD